MGTPRVMTAVLLVMCTMGYLQHFDDLPSPRLRKARTAVTTTKHLGDFRTDAFEYTQGMPCGFQFFWCIWFLGCSWLRFVLFEGAVSVLLLLDKAYMICQETPSLDS